jgi:hypothetical protein
VNILRTVEINLALERSLSRSRLQKYLVIADHDIHLAISHYEKNIRLSEALYTPLQGLEICLRNTIDSEMRVAYGENWLLNPPAAFQENTRNFIDEATRDLPNPTHDAIVAELKFAFWVSLLATRYDNTLWRKCLYRCFRGVRGVKRADAHGRLNAIRRFRNRVAHHEPIFDRSEQLHGEIIEAIQWMCPHTSRWVVSISRFAAVNAELRQP